MLIIKKDRVPSVYVQDEFVRTHDNIELTTAWESKPLDLARKSQAVLKTVEDTVPNSQFQNSIKSTFSSLPKQISY